MKKDKKPINEYVTGDVIRAIIKNKNVKKSKRPHSFIVLDSPRPKSNKKQHIVCVPACSFSKKPSGNPNKKCLDLSGYDLPDDFFDLKQPTTYLRFSEPSCLENYEIKKFITNLKSYPKLWTDICELMSENYHSEMGDLKSACDCNCLAENDIQVTFCSQDEDFLIAINPKIKEYQNCLVCSCCFEIIQKNKSNCDYVLCEGCQDNLFVTYIDNETGERVDVPKNYIY